MKRFQKLLPAAALVGLLTVLLAFPHASAAASAADVPDHYYPADVEGHWASERLVDFVQAGILDGNEGVEGTVLRPNDAVTRAEFAAILLRASGEPAATGASPFNDVKAGDWFYPSVLTAYKLGLVEGTAQGTFSPSRSITRGEISAMLVRLLDGTVSFEGADRTYTDTDKHWAASYIHQLSRAGIVDGYGETFRPDANATRAEAAVMIARGMERETAGAPEDSTLTGTVKQMVEEEYASLGRQDFGGVHMAADKYAMAFYRDAEAFSAYVLQSLTEEGYAVNVTVAGTAGYRVLHKSSRYAQVELKGLTERTVLTYDGQEDVYEEQVENTYSLRKVGGVWKVYGGAREYLALEPSLFE